MRSTATEQAHDAEWDQELSSYARGGEFFIITKSFQRPDVRIVERRLDDSEVHVARAMLLTASANVASERTAAEARELALTELREALHQDPRSMTARAMLAERGSLPTLAEARMLADRYPDDWLAWRLLSMAEARRGGERALVAGARALSRAASNPALRLDVIRLPLLAPARRDCTRFVPVVAKVLTDARGRVRELEILEGGGAEADATVRDAARELILERNPASDGDPPWRLVPFDVCSAGGAHGDAERPTLGSARGQR